MNWSVDVLMTRGAVAVSRGAGASAVSDSHHSKIRMQIFINKFQRIRIRIQIFKLGLRCFPLDQTRLSVCLFDCSVHTVHSTLQTAVLRIHHILVRIGIRLRTLLFRQFTFKTAGKNYFLSSYFLLIRYFLNLQ